MLNSSKKYLFIFSAFLLLIFFLWSAPILAQEQGDKIIDGMTVEIKEVKIQSADGALNVSAVLYNPSLNIETAPFTHLLVLESLTDFIQPKDANLMLPNLIVSASEGETFFTLKPRAEKTISLSLPINDFLPEGNYKLFLKAILKDGAVLGGYKETLRGLGANKGIEGVYAKGFAAFDIESCAVITPDNKNFGYNAGPLVKPSEALKARCAIKNIGSENLVVSPVVEWKESFVYSRPSMGKRLSEKSNEIITLKSQETKTVTVVLPKTDKPQVYQGLLRFVDGAGLSRSFNMFFRWTVEGATGRIDKVELKTANQAVYKKGEIVSISIDYFGPPSLYWTTEDNKTGGLSDLKIGAIINDKKGIYCGQAEELTADINDASRQNKILNIPMSKNCKGIKYEVDLFSNGQIVASASDSFPAMIKEINFWYIYIPLLIAVIIAIFIFIIRAKRGKKTVIGLLIFLAIFAIVFLDGNKVILAATKDTGILTTGGNVRGETDTVDTWTYTGEAYSGSQWGGRAFGTGGDDWSRIMYSFYSGGGVLVGKNKAKILYTSTYFNSSFNFDSNNPPKLNIDLSGLHEFDCTNESAKFRIGVLAKGADGFDKQIRISKEGGGASQYYLDGNFGDVLYGDFGMTIDINSTDFKNLFYPGGVLVTDPKLVVELRMIGRNHEGTSKPKFRGFFDNNLTIDGVQATDADRATKFDEAEAFVYSDVLKVKIPLNLPKPEINLKATVRSKSGTVIVGNNDGPVAMAYDDSLELTWTGANLDSCTAGVDNTDYSSLWSGSKSVSGSSGILKQLWKIGDFNPRTVIFSLNCSKNFGGIMGTFSPTDLVSVTINPPLLFNMLIKRIDDINTTIGVKVNITALANSETQNNFTVLFGKFAKAMSDKLAFIGGLSDCALSKSSTCSYSIPSLTQVTLDAMPDVQWSSPPCVSTSDPCVFVMPASNVVVEAEVGSSSVDGKCGSADGQTYSTQPSTNLCNYTSEISTTVTSNATATGWDWQCMGLNSGIDKSCSATKSSGSKTLTIQMTGDGSGYVWEDSGGGNYSIQVCKKDGGVPKNCTKSYASGTNVKLKAGTGGGSGSTFINGWSDCDTTGYVTGSASTSGNNATICNVTMSVDKTVTADFGYSNNPDTPVCSNSIVESGETCDDGNTVSGDGCSSGCIIEGGVPSVPTGLSGTAGICGGNINLSWNSVSGATSYTLYRSGFEFSGITGTSYADSSLGYSTSYEYKVRAYNGSTPSDYSSSVFVTSSEACEEEDDDLYSLTFKTAGTGSGYANFYYWRDDPWNDWDSVGGNLSRLDNNEQANIGKVNKFKLTAVADVGSYFSSWSQGEIACDSVSGNDCFLNENSSGTSKTATAAFNLNAVVGATCDPQVNIGAYQTVQNSDNTTNVYWYSAYADSCATSDGGNDTGWRNLTADIKLNSVYGLIKNFIKDVLAGTVSSKGTYTTNLINNTRTYTVACLNDSGSATDSVTVANGAVMSGTPTVGIEAFPNPVNSGEKAKLYWAASNMFSNQCPYLYSRTNQFTGSSYYNVAETTIFGPGYYKTGNSVAGIDGVETAPITSDTTFKIRCRGYDGSDHDAQTVVAVGTNLCGSGGGGGTNPPAVSITCDPVSCKGYKGVAAGNNGALKLSYSATDADGDLNSATCKFTGGGGVDYNLCSGTYWPTSDLISGSYTATMYAADNGNRSSNTSRAYTILEDIQADFDCSLDNSVFQSCSDIIAARNDSVYFKDTSTASGGASLNNWSWSFANGNPGSSSKQNPDAKFTSAGSSDITLTVTDSAGRTKSITQQIQVKEPLKPVWKEVIPR